MPLLIDRTNHQNISSIFYPFAFEEAMCHKVGEGHQPIIHLWQHPKAFVIGLRDSRLPYVNQAKKWLENQGFEVMVRHSGGAAVPLDNGVLNISIIQPINGEMYRFKQDFELIYGLLKDTLQTYSVRVEKGEVHGSYCPGDYDLSIDQKKFCGIAQRRQLKAFIVHAFINVLGVGSEKAKWVQQFYKIAPGEKQDEIHVPNIQLEKTGTLQELMEITSLEEFLFHLKSTLASYYGAELTYNESQKMDTIYQKEIQQMMEKLKMGYQITS